MLYFLIVVHRASCNTVSKAFYEDPVDVEGTFR